MNIFQKLIHFIFGCDYVAYWDSCNNWSLRIRHTPAGRPYVKWFSERWFMNADGTFSNMCGYWEGMTFKGGRLTWKEDHSA